MTILTGRGSFSAQPMSIKAKDQGKNAQKSITPTMTRIVMPMPFRIFLIMTQSVTDG